MPPPGYSITQPAVDTDNSSGDERRAESLGNPDLARNSIQIAACAGLRVKTYPMMPMTHPIPTQWVNGVVNGTIAACVTRMAGCVEQAGAVIASNQVHIGPGRMIRHGFGKGHRQHDFACRAHSTIKQKTRPHSPGPFRSGLHRSGMSPRICRQLRTQLEHWQTWQQPHSTIPLLRQMNFRRGDPLLRNGQRANSNRPPLDSTLVNFSLVRVSDPKSNQPEQHRVPSNRDLPKTAVFSHYQRAC